MKRTATLMRADGTLRMVKMDHITPWFLEAYSTLDRVQWDDEQDHVRVGYRERRYRCVYFTDRHATYVEESE